LTNHTESELAGVGRLTIYWQGWLPDGEPRAVVVIAHGAGEHSGRYGHVAERLVGEGYAVYALDHRGHGRSGGPRALISRMDDAVADLDTLIVEAAGRHAGKQVFLLGHSMGGSISVCYAMRHQQRLAGLILSSPLAALEAASPATLMVARILSALTPKLGVAAVDSSLVSRDPEVVKTYDQDPLVHHGKLPARTVAEIAAAISTFPEGVGSITIPTLILYAAADGLVPPSGSVMISERIGSQDKTVIPYEGLYHEIFNEPEQDRVLDDTCEWVRARVGAPSPSPQAQTGSR
jgi:alpha-beta hydrolase superfamily lysophospholipase